MPNLTNCSCGGILDIVYDYDYIKAHLTKETLKNRVNPTMWRYRELLPVEETTPNTPLRVGWSPLYKADRLAKEFNAEGIIYEQMKYCDYWGFERALVSHIMHDEYGWPVLSIDRLYNNGNSGQLRTRVQAFVESLEIKRIHKEEGKA